MDIHSKIFIAGHNGMVGSAITRELKKEGFHNIITIDSKSLDLRNQTAVKNFFEDKKPEYVFLAAAKVGGILANNTYKAEFLYDNLAIQNNVIHNSYLTGVKKLLFLGSSCIYPKFASQPLKEESLLTGVLEETNESYSIAKIAGIKMCDAYRDQYGCNFISVMPTNLYGYKDNYHSENSHVLPALIKKCHDAKRQGLAYLEVWGSGKPKREFLFADDLADACVFLMRTYNSADIINIGSGKEISIKDLALLIKKIVGFEGELLFDLSKPDGTPRKILDVSRLSELGWNYQVDLEVGIGLAYKNYLETSLKNQESQA